MKHLPSVTAADIRTAAPMATAITSLRAAFAGGPQHIARTSHPAAGGEILLMPAVDERTAGVKLLMVQPANAGHGRPVIQGTYVLFDAAAGEPVGLFDGAALTTLRTPAVSAVATDALSRTDARTLGIIGSGPQAIGHAEAMLCVRTGIESIVVASRTPANADAAAEAIARNCTSPAAVRAGSIDEAAACDIVCTATRSTEPVVHRSMVRAGAHINAVGAYRPDMCELAADLVAASTVVVDNVHAAQEEAGDLIRAVAEGAWAWDRIAGDLVDVGAGRIARRNADETTVFKSVGLAFADLVVARLVAEVMNLM